MTMGRNAAGRTGNQKISRSRAARKIAAVLEKHMTEQGLTETEKDAKVKQFATRVANATARRAKS